MSIPSLNLFGSISAAVMLVACSSAPASVSPPSGHEAVVVTVSVPSPAPPPSGEAAPRVARVDEWKVGAYLPLSGGEAAFGVETKEGIDLAVEEVNAAGGVRGRRVNVVYEDDRSNPQEAAKSVLQLIDGDGVVALLGEVSSARSKVGGIVANKRQVPMIATGATNPEVTRVGPFVFRACFIDSAQAIAAARFLVRDRKKQKIALLFAADDLYSSGLASVFREEVKRLGAPIVVEQSFLGRETDFGPVLKAIHARRPDAVYAPIYYDVMERIARQAKAEGIPGKVFMGGDGWDSPSLFENGGSDLEGATFTSHFAIDAPWDRARAFVTAYRQRFQHDPSSLGALGYDAAGILADAIGRASGDSAEDIREAIQATKGLQGVTGKVTIDGDRDADKGVIVVRIGKRNFVYETIVE